MKYLIVIAAMIASLYAADFTHMSTEEMMKMRGSVPVDQRDDFRKEMQKRMQSMTPEERQKYGMHGKGMMSGQGMMGMGDKGMMGNHCMKGSKGMMGHHCMHCCCCCCCQSMMKNRCMTGNKSMGKKGMKQKCGGQGMKQGQGMKCSGQGMMNN